MSAALIEYARKGQALHDVPVLDVHAHIDPLTDELRLPLEEHMAQMDRLGIDAALVSSSLAINGEIPKGNDHVAEAAARYPGRIFGYCHVSSRYPDEIVHELERCFANAIFRGIKVYQIGVDYDSPLFEPAWEFAAARRLPVLAHTWGGNVTGLDRAAEKHPDVPFLAAHTGSVFAYQPYIDAALRCPNLFLDLTYSREHTNMIEHIVATVGAHRLVWGSDVPCFSMAHQLGKILFARIPDSDKRRILFDNTARLFHLESMKRRA